MRATPGDLPVVAGADGTDAGLRAVGWAADEARRRRTALRLVFASGGRLNPPATPSASGEQSAAGVARHALAVSAERTRRHAPGVPVRAEIVAQEPIDALLEESRHAGLVVIGVRDGGEFTDLLRGCTGFTVAGRAGCPVVVVRGERPRREDRVRCVVLAVPDAGETAGPAAFAFAEAALRGCPVLAVRAWLPPRTPQAREAPPEQAAARERRRARDAAEEAVRGGSRAHPSVAADVRVREGRPRDVVLSCAEAADLVVTGTRRAGPLGPRTGSLPHALLHRSPCPVALVPQPS